MKRKVLGYGKTMAFRKTMALVALLGIVTLAPACISFTSWTHNKRHVKQMWMELHQLHEDMDRMLFGLERNPAE